MSRSHSVADYPGQIAGIAAIAASIGAITALFVSPRSGSQLRRSLKNKANTVKDSMNNRVETVGETVVAASDAIESKAEAAKDDMQDKKDEVEQKHK